MVGCSLRPFATAQQQQTLPFDRTVRAIFHSCRDRFAGCRSLHCRSCNPKDGCDRVCGVHFRRRSSVLSWSNLFEAASVGSFFHIKPPVGCRLLANFDVRDAATSCLKLRDERTRPAKDASSQFGPNPAVARPKQRAMSVPPQHADANRRRWRKAR
jgi:hypothetical protein